MQNLPKQRDGPLKGEPGYKGFRGDPAEYGDGSPDPDWPEAPVTELPLKPTNGNPSRTTLDEKQRCIIRQHSQSMALEVLKLKVELKELTVEDLTPAKLRQLADYFDTDVLDASSK